MGVEINPALCAAATENFSLNGITNAKVAVCDSGRFATQILRTKKYILYAPAQEPAPAEESSVTGSGIVDETCSSDAAAGSNSTTSDAAVYSNKSTAQLRATKSIEHHQQRASQPPRGKPHRAAGAKGPKVPLYEFNFGAVLVDPPRCGLDSLTLSLVASYDHVIYISCCPDSLMRDLTEVSCV
jgi:tRNA/tmRNA/rRNA uracil-C5-methylase (TrmA/RlmC/RlmD family)